MGIGHNSVFLEVVPDTGVFDTEAKLRANGTAVGSSAMLNGIRDKYNAPAYRTIIVNSTCFCSQCFNGKHKQY
jgi:hypothetical protein